MTLERFLGGDVDELGFYPAVARGDALGQGGLHVAPVLIAEVTADGDDGHDDPHHVFVRHHAIPLGA